MENLKNLINDIHETAKTKGWWDKDRSFGDVVSLIHSELSEALEFERNKNNMKKIGINYMHHYAGSIYLPESALNNPEVYIPIETPVGKTELMSNTVNEICTKPDGLLPELADAVIRVFDYVGKLDMVDEFIDVLLEKHEFNKTRPFLHGGKTL